jgi:hypothetical protein
LSLKSILLFVIIGVHLLAFYWLDLATRYVPLQRTESSVLLIDFITRETPPEPVRIISTQARQVDVATPLKRMQKTKIKSPTTPSERIETSTLTLINKDGSIVLPQQTRDAFLNDIEKREFDVQHKGLDDMEKILHRPVALEYKSTKFDGNWQGDKPRLERVLEEAVAKSTVRVKIPIPGRPGAYLRCGLAILAMGGGCGFTANDDGYFVRGDDPNTLSMEEDRQCKAWWDLIVSAKTQAIWRKTKKLYQQECEKPLAK